MATRKNVHKRLKENTDILKNDTKILTIMPGMRGTFGSELVLRINNLSYIINFTLPVFNKTVHVKVPTAIYELFHRKLIMKNQQLYGKNGAEVLTQNDKNADTISIGDMIQGQSNMAIDEFKAM